MKLSIKSRTSKILDCSTTGFVLTYSALSFILFKVWIGLLPSNSSKHNIIRFWIDLDNEQIQNFFFHFSTQKIETLILSRHKFLSYCAFRCIVLKIDGNYIKTMENHDEARKIKIRNFIIWWNYCFEATGKSAHFLIQIFKYLQFQENIILP